MTEDERDCAEAKAWRDNYDGMFWRWAECDAERVALKEALRQAELVRRTGADATGGGTMTEDAEALVLDEARRRMAWSRCVRVHDLAPGYVAGCCVCQQWADSLAILTPDDLAARLAAAREQAKAEALTEVQALAVEWQAAGDRMIEKNQDRRSPAAQQCWTEGYALRRHAAALRAALPAEPEEGEG